MTLLVLLQESVAGTGETILIRRLYCGKIQGLIYGTFSNHNQPANRPVYKKTEEIISSAH